MTVREMQKGFQSLAKLIGDYQSMTKTELANAYCDARHAAWAAAEAGNKREEAKQEQLRDCYHAALMLRYWYKIWEWTQNSKSLMLEGSDFVEWLAEGLWVAFYYETWRYEYQAIVKDGKFIDWKYDENGDKIKNPYYWLIDLDAPDKMINRCCGSIRGKHYQAYNKDKRKTHIYTESLDSLIDEEGDYAIQFTGCYVNNSHQYDNPAYFLINELLKRNEYVESLIIDGMSSKDSFKKETKTKIETCWDEDLAEYVDKEYETSYEVFDPKKLVKHLNQIDENYIYEFCEAYDVPEEAGKLIYEQLKKSTNNKLYKLIKKVQLEVTQQSELRSCLK